MAIGSYVPALAKRRVGSLWGTTGLDGQNLWPFPLKKSKYVSLTVLAGHWISDDGSEPGMTAAEEEKRKWERKGRRRVEEKTLDGEEDLRRRRRAALFNLIQTQQTPLSLSYSLPLDLLYYPIPFPSHIIKLNTKTKRKMFLFLLFWTRNVFLLIYGWFS